MHTETRITSESIARINLNAISSLFNYKSLNPCVIMTKFSYYLYYVAAQVYTDFKLVCFIVPDAHVQFDIYRSVCEKACTPTVLLRGHLINGGQCIQGEPHHLPQTLVRWSWAVKMEQLSSLLYFPLKLQSRPYACAFMEPLTPKKATVYSGLTFIIPKLFGIHVRSWVRRWMATFRLAQAIQEPFAVFQHLNDLSLFVLSGGDWSAGR